MKILSVVGARPQFVKLAPMSEAIARARHDHIIVHTGQHYDEDMSGAFFSDLAIPTPDVNLGVGSAGHAQQTAQMLVGIERELLANRPDWVLVYGDTNSTVAGALAAVKLHQAVAHIEAGLRSHNRRMPEEHNRVASDHLADLLLAPSPTAIQNLEREGLADRTAFVGDVMIDVLQLVRARVEHDPPLLPSPIPELRQFALATIHRAENTDDPVRLRSLVTALAHLPIPVVLSAHPRLIARAEQYDIDLQTGALHPIPPLSYPALVATVLKARSVITDSGGLQKEAHALATPCCTLRSETEWIETLHEGWNVLVAGATELEEYVLRDRPTGEPPSHYGDGGASRAIVAALESA